MQVADKLDSIANIYAYRGDKYRATAYLRAAENVRDKHEERIGTHIAEKIAEYRKTGKIKGLDDNPLFVAYSVLIKVLGAGPTVVRKWIAAGIRTLADLRSAVAKGMAITKIQEYGIKYYKDLSTPIPRRTVESIGKKVIKIIGGGLVVGSFRRGSAYSNDVDILVIDPDIDALDRSNITVLSRGPEKVMILFHDASRTAQVDIQITTKEAYPAALLYFTGSKPFNRRMRARASKMGMTLSEHGLRKSGRNLPLKSEKEIFAALDMPYVDPKKRL